MNQLHQEQNTSTPVLETYSLTVFFLISQTQVSHNFNRLVPDKILLQP